MVTAQQTHLEARACSSCGTTTRQVVTTHPDGRDHPDGGQWCVHCLPSTVETEGSEARTP